MALLDIMSSQKVRQIFKIQTVRKPDIFLSRRQAFKDGNFLEKKIKNSNSFQNNFFKIFSLIYFWQQISVKGSCLMRVDILVIKIFKNISPDSVQSGRTCPTNLGVWSCTVRKLICPVRLSPSKFVSSRMVWTQNRNVRYMLLCPNSPKTSLNK